MDVVATAIGVVVLVWIFLGPLVGYTLAARGWRLRSPLARQSDEGDEL